MGLWIEGLLLKTVCLSREIRAIYVKNEVRLNFLISKT